MFRYDIVWEKSRATGFLNSKRQPMRAHETLLVFYKSAGARYNVIKTAGEPYVHGNRAIIQGIYGNVGESSGTYIGRFPRSVKLVQNSGRTRHPTEKPVELLDWLVKSYSNPNDWVLDFTHGVGTTGASCLMNKRNYIGCEMNKEYFDVSVERLDKLCVHLPMEAWGYQLSLDCGGINNKKMKDENEIRQFVADILRRIDMEAWGDIHIMKLAADCPKHLSGFSCIQLLHTSSMTIHYCDRIGQLYFDLFSCKQFDSGVIIEEIKKYYEPKSLRMNFFTRGSV
jgi:S-adenosylmethionine/arginine decarboxylase-like enzyme